jgi:hypothetical protein
MTNLSCNAQGFDRVVSRIMRRWPDKAVASGEDNMKFAIIVSLAAATLAIAGPADAKGCLKGAAVGGVGGHVVGHHAVLGAAAGCAIGHHRAAKAAKAQTAAHH